MSRADRLIVALDATTAAEALRLAKQVRGLARTVKIGSVLFTACGPSVIARIRALGFRIMLDLKFFDIPSTVELSCRAAVRHRVSLVTVHASGGRAMLEAAVRGMRTEATRLRIARPKVLAVTVLTSVGRHSASAVRARVRALARDARQAGCDGVIASAQEAAMLRRTFGRAFQIVCPGIRPRAPQGRSGAASRADQRRVATPAEALARGADALVVGRPITAARRPRAAAQQLLHEMEDGHGC